MSTIREGERSIGTPSEFRPVLRSPPRPTDRLSAAPSDSQPFAAGLSVVPAVRHTGREHETEPHIAIVRITTRRALRLVLAVAVTAAAATWHHAATAIVAGCVWMWLTEPRG